MVGGGAAGSGQGGRESEIVRWWEGRGGRGGRGWGQGVVAIKGKVKCRGVSNNTDCV